MEGYKKGGYEPNRYFVQKSSGEPVDLKADYFVLRLDKDPHARKAIEAYARSVRSDNEVLYQDIMIRLSALYETDMVDCSSENYVEKVLRTDPEDYNPVMERLQNLETVRLLHAVMGMVTEAGELATELKKFIFYGKPLDKVNLKEEIGDETWYVGLAVDVLKTTMNDVLSGNIEKLRKRYPEKFTEGDALNRNKDNELSHFND